MTETVRIIAHRGASGSAPENTMAAYRLAASAGAEMIELDVRMTLDHAFVVLHDRNLQRTTEGRGSVRKKRSVEITDLDAGSWYHARFAGERVPTLQQVLAWLPSGMGVNIEVKTDGDRRPRSLVARRLHALIAESGMEHSRLLVSSFDHRLLRILHAIDSSLPLGVLYMAVRDAARRPMTLALRCGAAAFICSRAQLRGRHVRDAHAAHIAIICYGVDSESHFRQVLRLGVDAVITNFPARMVRLLHSA